MGSKRTWLAVDAEVHERLQAVSVGTGYTIRELTDEILGRFALVVYVEKLLERRRLRGPLSTDELETLREYGSVVDCIGRLSDTDSG
jgi:hypothetical protein